MTDQPCPFCELLVAKRTLAERPLAAAVADAFPLSPGHVLVVPRRHVADVFQLTAEELADVVTLVGEMHARLVDERRPDGFNVGVNVADAGGQTVAHAHVHVIPRYAGDVADPRGGVRWIIPARARYWASPDATKP